MKRSIFLFVFSALLFNSAVVFADKTTFFGVAIQNGSATHSLDGIDDIDMDSSGFSLYLGSEINDFSRIKGGMHFSNYESKDSEGLDIDNFGFEIDYLLFFKVNRLKPYLSVGMDSASWSYDEEYFGELSESSILGVGLRLGTGVLFHVSDSIEIDAGVLYKKIKWQDIEYIRFFGDNVTLKQDTSVLNFQLGLNYKF
ncbi:outer membrane beta-barrel protein [Marinospirillum insulare]|uniref:Outer membrane protein beta-barrel domain-containing protein n=1 Tax=Marinospirillum insulare TaxID=217169 RepID=A0ABQ5ZYV1_9GAMM|nr:outer membrane beta-barrel protein [Marinospirillum insulare]GLR64215.1 hypothetical protein GCM10007878_16530 [Marinospirillum insulare]